MRKSILIVEDDSEIRETMTFILEDEGYIVMAAANGKEALSVLNATEEMPGLVLLDLMMPVMDGISFREAQKSDPTIAHLPTVILSADTNLIHRAQSLGVNEFMKKPVDLYDLFSVAERYCT